MKTLSNLVKVIKLMQTSWFLVCLKICVVPNIGIKVMRSIRSCEISLEGVIVFNVLSGNNNPHESASLFAIWRNVILKTDTSNFKQLEA